MKLPEEVLDAAVQIADGWYPAPTRIDWIDLLDRLEDQTGADLGEDMTARHIAQIKQHVRRSRG